MSARSVQLLAENRSFSDALRNAALCKFVAGEIAAARESVLSPSPDLEITAQIKKAATDQSRPFLFVGQNLGKT